MRRIILVTTGRSDYGLYRPIMDCIAGHADLNYELLVSGGHLSERSGSTVREIEAEGRPIAARLTTRETLGAPAAMAAAMGEIMLGAADYFSRSRPDILVVLGDRFEMFAAAAAAVPLNIPIAHIHGGELSFGAIDDAFRHALTKLSHLHFAATRTYARRIVRMGEEPWRVVVSGAPGIDTIVNTPLPSKADLARHFRFPLDRPPVLMTFHPVTREFEDGRYQIAEILAALEGFDVPLVISAPNADAGSDVIRLAIETFAAARRHVWVVENFGSLNYLAMLRESAAMIGNSSSGILEAPSFCLPTVNIGSRQDGRIRALSVIDCPCERTAIDGALRKALDPAFRRSLAGMDNPYGDGRAADRIVETLASVSLNRQLLAKRFFDGPDAS
jgi:UDP-hydrolysing UDP-N-acetyl-D-glucosamine 2-epimerase